MEDNQRELLHDMQLMAEAVHKLDIAVQMIIERMEDLEMIPDKEEFLGMVAVSYTHLTLPTNREV